MARERKTDRGVRNRIAATAARIVAEEGADYAFAKKKALRQVAGRTRANGNIVPDNSEVEDEVRRYNALFLRDSQPARLLQLRLAALKMMRELADFHPHLTGAVLNGTGGEQSEIQLQLFTENAKDVAIFLLNQGISFDVEALVTSQKEITEIIRFSAENEAFCLTIHTPTAMYRMIKKGRQSAERADASGLMRLIAQDTG
ncbi:MAG: hypothetical protein LBK01_07860 [Burkholderiaceae bacterium]|jgi:hypothetical protein|nr:hypothetical protein [Burkholderiaceae bacterium]